MSILRPILGDQLSLSLSSLSDIDSRNDIVLMVEVHDETTYVPHHKQKVVFILSAMRHFAHLLREKGITVDYVQLDDQNNSGSFTGEIKRALARHKVQRIVVTEPGEWRVWDMIDSWAKRFNIPVEIRDDRRFLCSRSEFKDWAAGRKSLRMEYFYRQMRRQTGWLMSGDEPEGGKWNYDVENRKALPKSLQIPERLRFPADDITKEVLLLVEKRFTNHFGDLQSLGWAVTRDNALRALQHFIKECLPQFGDYQDAMKQEGDFLFHALLSPYLNIGLLDPEEVCISVLDAYDAGTVPLAATEGFIRQIIGWREFIRGIYWLYMPDYARSNFFGARRSLPAFYWTAETDMNCLHQCIDATRRNAYAHHIQRLMITGNFALLAGIDPAEVEEWYLSVYADAFEWVELPNTHGMALHADGGLLGSKPYAASGSYINRMSDYCKECVYNPKVKLGKNACPFNYLYWYFLIKNEKTLKSNPRMAMPYRNLSRMTEERKSEILKQAKQFLGQF